MQLNEGWKLATAMLMYERVAIGGAGAGKINQPQFKQLLKAARETGQIDNPVVRDQLMQIWSMETTKSLVAMKNRDEQKAGKTPGPGGSLGKLFGSVIAWKVRAMMLEFAGPGSVAWDPSDETGGERVQDGAELVPVRHRRRHRRDPAQHHRRPRARPAA